MSKNIVKEIDFGYLTAKEYFTEIVVPSHERFRENQKRNAAIEAALPAWHVHEWVWYEGNPVINTQSNKDYSMFRDQLINRCEELAWVRDIADAGKHRYLGRSADVQGMHLRPPTRGGLKMAGGGVLRATDRDGRHGYLLATSPGGLEIELADGSTRLVSTALTAVVKFWRSYFEVPGGA